MSEIKYNKRKWHIVEVNGYYGLRRVSWLGTNWYLSKYSDFEWSEESKVVQYCLYNTLEKAEETLNNIYKNEKRKKTFKNPKFIKQ